MVSLIITHIHCLSYRWKIEKKKRIRIDMFDKKKSIPYTTIPQQQPRYKVNE